MGFSTSYHPEGIEADSDPQRRAQALKRAENAWGLGKGDCAKHAARVAGTTCREMMDDPPRHGAITEGELSKAAERSREYHNVSDGRRNPRE